MHLLDRLNEMNRLVEVLAHNPGQDHEAAWDDLAAVYQSQPRIEANLDLLECASARELIRALIEANEEVTWPQ
jgi:hypothetical protein